MLFNRASCALCGMSAICRNVLFVSSKELQLSKSRKFVSKFHSLVRPALIVTIDLAERPSRPNLSSTSVLRPNPPNPCEKVPLVGSDETPRALAVPHLRRRFSGPSNHI